MCVTMVVGAGAGVGLSVTTGGSVGGTHWGHGKRSYLTYGVNTGVEGCYTGGEGCNNSASIV
jgi:hypothetical protein